jgi:hypothetical protein
MQLAPQTVDKLQNTAGFGFHDRLHHQLATAIQHRDHYRFLVHVHADILDVATHKVASLGERTSRSTESFPQGTVSSFTQFAHLQAGPLSHNALTHFEWLRSREKLESNLGQLAAEHRAKPWSVT